MSEMKFKIGDHVVIENSNVDCLENLAGCTGVVKKYWNTESGYDYLIDVDDRPGLSVWCNVKCLVDVEVEVDGFKVGDRVNVGGMTGTIICISMGDLFGVQFDDEDYPGHRCLAVKLKAGSPSTTENCWWVKAKSLVKIETPKYYNGKVVCVESKRPNEFTVGKVYTFENGSVVDNNGKRRYGLVTDLSHIKTLRKFIPLVE